MTDFLPLIVERLNATSGQGRRVTVAELQAYLTQALTWMPDFSVLAKGAGAASSIGLAPGQLFGRAAGGAFQGIGKTDLDAILELGARFSATAPAVHSHGFVSGIPEIKWSTLAEGRILARLGGEFVWIPIPTGGFGGTGGTGGGGGNVFNPLRANLDIKGFAIEDEGAELIRVSGGKLLICGLPFPKFVPGTPGPVPGDIWVGGPGGTWIHRPLDGDDIRIGNPGLGGDLSTGLGILIELINQKAPITHTHELGEVRGTTPGKLVAIGPGPEFPLIEVDPPSGGPGGGLQNPLNQDLDLGEYGVIGGGRELIRIVNGVLRVGGLPVIPSIIENPEQGQIPCYDESVEAFLNETLTSAKVQVPGDIPGANLEAALYALLQSVAGKASLSHVHGIGQVAGSTAGKYIAVGPAPLFRLIEVDAPSGGPGGGLPNPLNEDLDLGGQAIVDGARELIKVVGGRVRVDGRDVIPSIITDPKQGQIPRYDETVEAFVNFDSSSPGGNLEGTAFPAEFAVNSSFFRSDLRRTYVRRNDIGSAGVNAWVADAEQTMTENGVNIAADQGGGAYLVGNGDEAGYLFDGAAVITGVTVAMSTAQTGTVRIQAWTAGPANDLVELDLTNAKTGSISGQIALIPAGAIVSIFLEAFSAPVADIGIRLTFREAEQ